MKFSIDPLGLTWEDVDPATHPFDPTVVPSMVPDPRAGRESAWQHDISHAFVDRYGIWACGWASLTMPPPDGTAQQKFLHEYWADDPESARRMAADSLLGWREWLEELGAFFDEFSLLLNDAETQAQRWEQAVVRLIAMAVERIAEDEFWYCYCEQILSWFLTASGVLPERAEDLLWTATNGRFSSWVTASESTAAEVARTIATELSGA
ncbi:hypothetical protein [Embleya sp. NPDC005575]|uniref:hypothetical protein n=1 Tax=Embleya sp. NPDC005575 TaxID=3156892 RepID=UPI0033A9492F